MSVIHSCFHFVTEVDGESWRFTMILACLRHLCWHGVYWTKVRQWKYCYISGQPWWKMSTLNGRGWYWSSGHAMSIIVFHKVTSSRMKLPLLLCVLRKRTRTQNGWNEKQENLNVIIRTPNRHWSPMPIPFRWENGSLRLYRFGCVRFIFVCPIHPSFEWPVTLFYWYWEKTIGHASRRIRVSLSLSVSQSVWSHFIRVDMCFYFPPPNISFPLSFFYVAFLFLCFFWSFVT